MNHPTQPFGDAEIISIDSPANETASASPDSSLNGSAPNAESGEFTPPPIDSLPPELQAIAKGFQADYTKKRQQDADKLKAYEQFEEMLTSPEKAKTLIAAIQARAGLQTDPAAATTPKVQDPFEGVDPKAVLSDEAHTAISALQHRGLKEFMTPILQEFAQARQELQELRQYIAEGQFQTERQSLAKEYPSLTDAHYAQAQKLAKQTGLSIKQAVFAVAGEDLLKSLPKAGPAQPETATDKAKSLLTRNGVGSVNGKPTNGSKSFTEAAFQLIREAQLNSGYRRG